MEWLHRLEEIDKAPNLSVIVWPPEVKPEIGIDRRKDNDASELNRPASAEEDKAALGGIFHFWCRRSGLTPQTKARSSGYAASSKEYSSAARYG